MHYFKPKQTGFTIIELMIATTIFTVVLLLSTYALLQIGKVYSKGVNSSATQAAARSIVDEVAQAIQFSGGAVESPTPAMSGQYYFKAGGKCYTYVLGKQLVDASPQSDQSLHAFTRNDDPTCSAPIDWAAGNFTELLGPRMRIAAFYLCKPGDGISTSCQSPTPSSSTLYSVGVRVVYGDKDLLCRQTIGNCNNNSVLADGDLPSADLDCKGSAGSQYCAESQIVTTVQKRQ